MAVLREFENPFLTVCPIRAKGQQITNFVQLDCTDYCQNANKTVAMHLAFGPH